MKRIGLVVALEAERNSLYLKLGDYLKKENYGNIVVTQFKKGDLQIYMADSGIGEISAALATQLLIIKYGVEIIINFGVVGSLVNKYNSGDVVLVGEVVHYDFSMQLSDKNMAGKYPFSRDNFVLNANIKYLEIAKQLLGNINIVRIASGDKFVDMTDMKNWLVNHFSCEICDMESAGIHLACSNNSIPYIMIKAVSDNADESAAQDFAETVTKGISFYINAVEAIIDAIS